MGVQHLPKSKQFFSQFRRFRVQKAQINMEVCEDAAGARTETETAVDASSASEDNLFGGMAGWVDANKRDPRSDDGLTPGRMNLRKWLGKKFRVVITDGRVLVGYFNCTDKDANVVLSMCAEYLEEGKDARILGNVMIPGKHIVSISVDMPKDEVAQAEAETSRKSTLIE